MAWTGLEQYLTSQWQQRTWFTTLLRPVSCLYTSLLERRWQQYASQTRSVEQQPVPVLVVGNVVAGGAGKTPTTIAIAKHLSAKGIRIGLVSRGYASSGSQAHTPIEVTANSSAAAVGDEPLLLSRHTQAPVFVHTQRALAAQALLQAYPSTQIVLCDDGLQHWALWRDIEVCVFDDRDIGNGWLLPAGPLREPWPRRYLAACGQDPAHSLFLHTEANRLSDATHLATRRLADYAVNAHGEQRPLNQLQDGKPLIAMAGIARPERFFLMLQDTGLQPSQTITLPDHFAYSPSMLAQFAHTTILCTEKDATKLWQWRPDAWAIPLELSIPQAWWDRLDSLLHAQLQRGHSV